MKGLYPGLLTTLLYYDWPGNEREVINALRAGY